MSGKKAELLRNKRSEGKVNNLIYDILSHVAPRGSSGSQCNADIFSDEVAKNFWTQQLPKLITKFADQAIESEKTENNDVEDTNKRVSSYTTEYHGKIDKLMAK
jgi:hypothetical protein